MLRVGRWSKQWCQGTKSCNGEYTDNTAPEEDAHRGAGGCGAGWSPVLAGPKVANTSKINPKDTELLALSQRACAIIPTLASS